MINKEQLLQLREDLSPFLIHLTRNGFVSVKKDIFPNAKSGTVSLNARQSLDSIIRDKMIKARSPYGYFNFKVKLKKANGKVSNPHSLIERKWLTSVCFTETPVDHVHLQCKQISGRQLHFQPYGLAFFEDAVRKQGGNPVFYVDSTNQNIRHAWDQIPTLPNCADFKSIMPLVEGFGPPFYKRFDSPNEIDFRWEREWRVPGHFKFDFSDVAFGLCKAPDISNFESMVGGSFPFVDPTEDLANVKAKLKNWPKLKSFRWEKS